MKSICYVILFMFYFNFNYIISLEKTLSLFKTNAEKLNLIHHNKKNSLIHNIMQNKKEDQYNFQNNFLEKFSFKSNSKNFMVNQYGSTLISGTNKVVQGWLKYVEISENDFISPSNFKKNKMYFNQKFDNEGQIIIRDSIGFVNIPNESYFFFELDQVSLKVFTGRFGKYKELIAQLSINSLVPEINLNPCKGGIEDVGNFSEGFCFMLKFIRFSRHIIWELCADTIEEKDRWMNSLIYLNNLINAPNQNTMAENSIFLSNNSDYVIPRTSEIGTDKTKTILSSMNFPTDIDGTVNIINSDIILPGFVVSHNWSSCSKPCGQGIQIRTLMCTDPDKCRGEIVQQKLCNIKACKQDVENHLKNLKKVAEGKWEYLGNWSPCSKSCGVGIQEIKRICVGKDDCIGEKILTKPCNIFTCQPEIKVEEEGILSKCTNLKGEFNLLQQQAKNYIPTIVEINMNNVEIYKSDDRIKPFYILSLDKLNQIENSVKHPECLKLVSSNTGEKIRLCNCMKERKGANQCKEWVQKIKEFKNKCSSEALEKIINEISKNSVKTDPSKRIEILQKKLNIKQDQESKIKLRTLELQFEEFKKQAKELLQKEEAYEQKVQTQEKERIDWEGKKLDDAVKNEELIAQKILLDMQHISNRENSYKTKEFAIRRQMKEMMKNIQDTILINREKMINNIQNMRKTENLKQEGVIQHLIDTKTSIGKKIISINKRGNPSQCFLNAHDSTFIKQYCQLNYLHSTLKSECLRNDQFCYLCCDNEIGLNNKENLNCCYNKCDLRTNSQNNCGEFYHSYEILDVDPYGAV